MKKLKQTLLILAMVLLTTVSAFATNVRGQVFFAGRYGKAPAANLTVAFYLWDSSNPSRPRLVPAYSPSITDRNGMYYFYNIAPRSYVVRISYKGVVKSKFNITIPNLPQRPGVFYDISPITIR